MTACIEPTTVAAACDEPRCSTARWCFAWATMAPGFRICRAARCANGRRGGPSCARDVSAPSHRHDVRRPHRRGVHAISQYVSVPAHREELTIEHRRWMRAMAALLPDDIALSGVYHAAPGFSARFDARSRTYTYRIATGDARPLLTRNVTWWHRLPLDVEAMERAPRIWWASTTSRAFARCPPRWENPRAAT